MLKTNESYILEGCFICKLYLDLKTEIRKNRITIRLFFQVAVMLHLGMGLSEQSISWSQASFAIVARHAWQRAQPDNFTW